MPPLICPRDQRLTRWLDRIAYVSGLPIADQEDLKITCRARGFHVASGEMLLTARPTHFCFECLEKFQEPDVAEVGLAPA